MTALPNVIAWTPHPMREGGIPWRRPTPVAAPLLAAWLRDLGAGWRIAWSAAGVAPVSPSHVLAGAPRC